MSFSGFKPKKKNDEDEITNSRNNGDHASDSGYGGSIGSDFGINESHSHSERSQPGHATYERGTSTISHHRSPSSKLKNFQVFIFYSSRLILDLLNNSFNTSSCHVTGKPTTIQ